MACAQIVSIGISMVIWMTEKEPNRYEPALETIELYPSVSLHNFSKLVGDPISASSPIYSADTSHDKPFDGHVADGNSDRTETIRGQASVRMDATTSSFRGVARPPGSAVWALPVSCRWLGSPGMGDHNPSNRGHSSGCVRVFDLIEWNSGGGKNRLFHRIYI
jgi:hypothetical protein